MRGAVNRPSELRTRNSEQVLRSLLYLRSRLGGRLYRTSWHDERYTYILVCNSDLHDESWRQREADHVLSLAGVAVRNNTDTPVL